LKPVPPARTEAPAGCGAPHRIPAIIIGRYARGRLRSTSCWWSHNAQLCSPERIGGAPPALRTRAPESNRCASAACPRETAPVISRLRARRATSVLGHAPRAEQPLSTATQDRACSRVPSQGSSTTLNRRARTSRSLGTTALRSQQIGGRLRRYRSPGGTCGHAGRGGDDLSRCVFNRHRCRGTAIPPPRITAR